MCSYTSIQNIDVATPACQIFAAYADERLGATALADRLNDAGQRNRGGRLWANQAVLRVIRNPVYIAKITHGTEIYDAKHEPIVDEAFFARAQALLDERSTEPAVVAPSTSEYLLSGLVRCQGLPRRACGRGRTWPQRLLPLLRLPHPPSQRSTRLLGSTRPGPDYTITLSFGTTSGSSSPPTHSTTTGGTTSPPAPTRYTTTTTLTDTPNPAAVGETVALTSTTTFEGSPVTGGTVTFSYNGAQLCSGVAVSSGSASCATTALPAGTDTVTATYSGVAGQYTPSSGQPTIHVGANPPPVYYPTCARRRSEATERERRSRRRSPTPSETRSSARTCRSLRSLAAGPGRLQP